MNIDAFIELCHKGQMRKTGEKYTSHLYAVRDILVEEGVDEKVILDAALLHDILEDSDMTRDYLSFRFGDHVANIVYHLSKEKIWNTEYCKVKSYMDAMEESSFEYPETILIKMADRLHNLQTISGFSDEKKREYIRETNESLLPLFRTIISHSKIKKFRQHLENLLKKLENEVEKIENTLLIST